MVFVALSNGAVVGGLTSYILAPYYSEKPLAYIYDLAVLTSYQRKGLGKMLIANITDHCQKQRFEGIFVQAELVDEHAIDFYRSTGGIEEQIAYFYYDLNEKN